jgi:diguanylate cyclase (GGDEF)-like protein
VLFDIDHFKRVNDELGHAGGDVVLQDVARSVRASIRPADYFARVGGEEFAVLLPETDGNQAAAAAERLRADIAASTVMVDGHARSVTASFGVAQLDRSHGTIEAWMALADTSLYRAKRNGRNRCEFMPSSVPGAPIAVTETVTNSSVH